MLSEEVSPYLQNLGHQFSGGNSTFTQHMKGARFTIPNAQLLMKVVEEMDEDKILMSTAQDDVVPSGKRAR